MEGENKARSVSQTWFSVEQVKLEEYIPLDVAQYLDLQYNDTVKMDIFGLLVEKG